MKPVTVGAVLEVLEREDGVAIGARERTVQVLRGGPPSLPWYARGVSGFYGWVAAGCFLVAAYELELWQGRAVVAGLAALVAGVLLHRRHPRGYFSHLSLALCLAGEVVAIHGVNDLPIATLGVSAFALALELLLLVTYRDALMRLLCTLGASIAVCNLWDELVGSRSVDALLLASLAGALLLFHLARGRRKAFWTPVAFGLSLASAGLMLGALERWERLSLGWPARAGVAALLLVQLLVVLRERRAPAWMTPLALAGVGGLAAFSFSSPGVLAAVALLVAAQHRREPRLAGLAAVFLALFYSHLYYQLDGSLLTKSGLMLGNGACLLLLGFCAGHRETLRADPVMLRRVLVASLLGTLAVVNALVVHKESVVRSGTEVLVELRPTDPRSLMQGDYMTLRYRIADRPDAPAHDGRMVVALDGDRVAAFRRFDDGSALQPGEQLLRFRRRDGAVRLGAEAFFFQEERGELYAKARYGELRVTKRGDAVLVGLRDAQRHRLGRSLR